MTQSYASSEKLGPKKLISKTATISTINIGVEDFLEPDSPEEAPNGSSQRPPRRYGGSVHFNMPAASTKASPRHTVQINKIAPAPKASNGNGPVRDSSAVFSSIANRGKKFPGSNLVRPLHRDVNPSEAFSRQATSVRGQKQRPSTAGASCERSSEGKSNVILRHSSCELRENSGEEFKTACAPLPQRGFLSRCSPDPLQDRCSKFGISMRDMSESLSKIEELIFPSKAGQEVKMRENMAFETSPVNSADFPELEDGSIKPLYRSPLARSYSRSSDGDLEKSENATVSCARKQRRAQSVVKGRRRKDRFHEKSQSCDNERTIREVVNRRWTKMRSSAEFSSSSLPLYADRSDSDSAASTEEGGDEPATRRRWPKVPQFFSSSAVRLCRDHSASKSESSSVEIDSATTQIDTEADALTEQSDTSGWPMGRSLGKIGKSRRSKLENSNLAGDRTTTGHELATTESGGEGEKLPDTVFNVKRNEGFEEESEVLCKTACYDKRGPGIEQNYGDNVGCSSQPAKELECSSSSENTSGKDTTMIVLPTSTVSYGQTTFANRTAPVQVEQGPSHQDTETHLLFPTKEAQEQQIQSSNSIKCSSIRSLETLQLENHKELGLDEEWSLSSAEVSPPHAKIQIHPQNSEKVLPHKHLSFYFEDSSSVSESADEKHVDSSGVEHHDELDSESRDAFDVRCHKIRPGSLKICAQKGVEVEDKAPSSILQASQAEEKYMHASLSTEKLCSILSYLGQVEQSNLQENLGISAEKVNSRGACFYSPRENGSPRAVLEHAEDAVSLTSSSQTAHSSFQLSADAGLDSRPSECNPAIAATTVFDGVRKKVQELKQKIAEQEAKIAESKAENEKLIREREKHMLMEREKYHKQLEDQAAEYKVIIQHHLSVNEKMLRDKEQLSEKCCNLAGILSVAESKFDEKVKQLSEQWSREMKKAKELWTVGEKQRQKQWQEKKIKDLKETAIRGLEPHLDNLNEKHRQELAKQESRHAEELQGKLDAQHLEYRRHMCELRDHLQQERDKMLDNERLAAHARMAEVAEKFEQQAIQQRMRVATDITAQLERSEAGRREDKQYSQELLARLQKEASEREEIVRKQMEKNLEEMAMKKDRQIEQLKSQMIATAHQFQQKFDDRICEAMKEKEKELLAKLTKERDDQIELVIEKLESEKEDLIAQEVTTKVNEVLAAKREVEQELKEFKSKFAELSKAVLSHKADTDMELEEAGKKVASLRREIQNQAHVIEELRNQVSQYDTMLKDQEGVFEARLKDEQTRLQQTESDLHQSNSKANEMRTRKVEELAEVEARVRQAIVKKDVVIASLREQLLASHRQIKATEYLLQREHNAFVRES